jgi:GNAT superfamily N-acetyltransferase
MIGIRLAVEADIEEIAALLRQLWPGKPQDMAALRHTFGRAIASGTQHYFCAALGDRIVGFVSLHFKNSLWQEGMLANVDELVVDAAVRGQGVGCALIDHAIVLAHANGCTRIELDSAFNRTEAHTFYENRGFEKRALLFSKEL